MTRGRRREFGKAAEIARLLSRGISYPSIAGQVDLSTQQVKRRVQNLRLLLAEETGDEAWVNTPTPYANNTVLQAPLPPLPGSLLPEDVPRGRARGAARTSLGRA